MFYSAFILKNHYVIFLLDFKSFYFLQDYYGHSYISISLILETKIFKVSDIYMGSIFAFFLNKIYFFQDSYSLKY